MKEQPSRVSPAADLRSVGSPSKASASHGSGVASAEVKAAPAGEAKASKSARKAVATKAMAKKVATASKPTPAKKAAKAPVQPAAAAPKQQAADKASKKASRLRPLLVRDSFTMPEADFDLIAVLKSRALDARRAAKKSELLRAGLRLLSGLEAKDLVSALDKLEPVKVGRPKKGH